MKTLLLSFMVIAAGALLPTQAGINYKLSQVLNSNILAALVSFIVGTLALLLYFILFYFKSPSLQVLTSAPWWVWTGGLCGAFYVAISIIAAPQLGATTLFTFFLTGQLLASLVLDHYGLIGFPVNEISAWRLFGFVLVVCGSLIIKLL